MNTNFAKVSNRKQTFSLNAYLLSAGKRHYRVKVGKLFGIVKELCGVISCSKSK